jgi:hypothetical protein
MASSIVYHPSKISLAASRKKEILLIKSKELHRHLQKHTITVLWQMILETGMKNALDERMHR